jgi:hypothetical protein
MVRRFTAITVLAVVAILASNAVPSGAQSDGGLQVSGAGVGKPPPGAGMGTPAALKNPKCDAQSIAGWGTFPMVTTTAGPYCVAPAPKNNGGATSRGVTRDKIKVVFVEPFDRDLGTNRTTGATTSLKPAVLDTWAALSHVYETWGREPDFVFLKSSGRGEAEQRADALKVAAEKPMFVIDSDPNGLSTLVTTLAKQKYVVFSESANAHTSSALAPYLWGLVDDQAGAANAAEFIGKQLVGGKAQYAGDKSMQHQTRKFGLVYPEGTDISGFLSTFKRFKGELATPPLAYTASGSPLGDASTAAQQAPTIIAKLKSAGVTSVIPLTDIAMTGAMTHVATDQGYSPEWVITGSQYQDEVTLARSSYDQHQWAHAFGITNLTPPLKGGPPFSDTVLLDWYWGPNTGSYSRGTGYMIHWLADAIQYAGPTLTPDNVERGLFAVPARGGPAWHDTTTGQVGYGNTSGLAYPSHLQGGVDFVPIWYDGDTEGPSSLFIVGKGVNHYLDGGKRYTAGTWPTKPLTFFKDKGTIIESTPNAATTGSPAPCTDCPSQGGSGTPASS